MAGRWPTIWKSSATDLNPNKRDLAALINARRMRRRFSPHSVDRDWLEATLDLARRAPSAGNAQGLDWLVLDTPAATARYWDLTLGEGQVSFTHQGLITAPVLVVVIADPDAYLARYREHDKAASGLGGDAGAWPVPYWFVDAGMAVQNLVLAVEDARMSACFFGLFGHERTVLDAYGVPANRRGVGTIAIGHRAEVTEPPGHSATRPRRSGIIHRGSW